MTEKDKVLNKEIVEHIQTCPSCARSARAMRVLHDLMDGSRIEDQFISFDDIRRKVNAAAAAQTRWEKIMKLIKGQYNARPKLITGLSFVAMVALFVTLVPFSYNQTIGYNVALCCADAENIPREEVLETTLTIAGYEDVDIELTEVGETINLAIKNLPNKIIAKNLAEAFSRIVQATGEPAINPVTDKKLATLYVQAVDLYEKAKSAPHRKLVELYVQAAESDEEERKTLARKAVSQYAQAVALNKKKEPEKVRPIQMKMTFEKQKIIINDHAVSDILYSKTMSDDEIEREFEKIIAGDGIDLDGVDIEVTTDADMIERTIRISSVDELSMAVNEDELVSMGITDDEIYLRTTEESMEAGSVDSTFELKFPTIEKSLKSKGIILKIMLDDFEE